MKRNILVTGIVLILLLSFCKKNEDNGIIYHSTLKELDPVWYNYTSVSSTCGFNAGSYEISIFQADYYACALAPTSNINDPYSLKADVSIQLSDTTKTGYAGLIFDFADFSNYYALLISQAGYFEICRIMDGGLSNPIPWTQTSAIKSKSGEINTLELNQNSTSLEIVINNTHIAISPIVKTAFCKVGLITVGAYSSVNFTKVVGSFNNLLIQKL